MIKITGSRHTFFDPEDEFIAIVQDILDNPEFQRLKNYTHHLYTTRYQHCLNVSYYTYYWCKKEHLNYVSATRGALLHDFYLYDHHKGEQPVEGRHSDIHPQIALVNSQHYFEVDDIMVDCISRHMWPMTKGKPQTNEGLVVSLCDKYCASLEWGDHEVKFLTNQLKKAYSVLSRS